ncbi:hypothetical protein [Hymenobacter rigui]|uniref:Uncharacterized protein n=1 Tax=Hymenobacter rigui TaxID=334424 RepID=A0A428KW99_9BACT|nr:hypothetical protein [Hymenobacter rigui]RSK51024.1 hypothetical protein EI291_01520 [Hymenobacter rigui]
MKIFFASAVALLLGISAASAQTTQSTPTVNGSVSPQSAPPAQPQGSLGTLPASNTQPASDRATMTPNTSPTMTREQRKNKAMEKRDKKKMKTSNGSTY